MLAVGTGLLLIAAHGHAQERSSTDAMLVAVAARDVILYYVVDEISRTYRGMMIAIPEPEGKPFDSIGPEELARLLVALAGRVKLARFCRHPHGVKMPVPAGARDTTHTHVVTARLLAKSRERRAPREG